MCYEPSWDTKRRAKYLIRCNAELKHLREVQKKAKKEKEARLKKANEFRDTKKNGFIKYNVVDLNKVIFEYVKVTKISLSNGKIVVKCTYWWVNRVI